MSAVVDVLTNPDEFFADRAESPSLKYPALIVLLTGLVGVLSIIPIFNAMSGAFDGGLGTILAAGQVIGAIFGLFFVFVFWFINAGLFHVISMLFDGEGDFRDTFTLVGWGYIPRIFSSIISVGSTFYVYSDVQFPSDPEQIQQFSQSIQNDPILTGASLLGVVFALWSGFIWTFAVKHARNLELREAAITVAIPVGLGIVWTLFSVFVL